MRLEQTSSERHQFEFTTKEAPRGLVSAVCEVCGKGEMDPAHAMRYRDLLRAILRLSLEQLDQPVRWWGDEKGGIVQSVHVLEEPYVDMSEGEGLEPLSVYVGTDDEEAAREAIELEAGTVILVVN